MPRAPTLQFPALLAGARGPVFSREELQAYEREILCCADADERAASRFFQRFPNFLLLGNSAELRREVVLVRPGVKDRPRVDFFRRKFGRKYWDIIELKDPRSPVVSGINSAHPHWSASVTKAINQALNYKHWIAANPEVRDKLQQKGINVYRPQILVVIGKNASPVSDEVMQTLWDRVAQHTVEMITYTEIFDFAREHFRATGTIVVPVLITSSRTTQCPVFQEFLSDRKSILDHQRQLEQTGPTTFHKACREWISRTRSPKKAATSKTLHELGDQLPHEPIG